MTDKPNLRDDLLRQNGASANTSVVIRDKILAEDQRQLRRMKWIAGRCWALFLVFLVLTVFLAYGGRHGFSFLGANNAEAMSYLLSEHRWLVPMAIVVAQAWFFLAVIVTFSLHVRSRTLTMHQIQATLAGIEEQLRKMTEKQP